MKTVTRPTLHLKRGPAPRHTFYLKRRFRKFDASQSDNFIQRVQARAPNLQPEATHRATHAVLETLGQYLSPHQARRLTAQLPREFAESARRSAGHGGPAGVDHLYAQIADKANLSPEDAMVHARTVINVLRRTVSENELADAMLKLPRDFDELVT